jgi:hypothetical protein
MTLSNQNKLYTFSETKINLKMKKLLLITLSCLTLFSCQKESNVSEPEIDKPKYNVTLSMEGFTQDVVKMTTSTKSTLGVGDTLKNYADNLCYRIYNTSGVLINSVNQASTLSTFGTVTDKLPSGVYDVFIGATKGSMYVSGAEYLYANASYGWDGAGYWNDTFTKQVKLTVGTTDVAQAVRLDRAVGGLEVTLQDAIPSNATRISIVFQNDSRFNNVSGIVNSYGGTSTTQNYTLTAFDVGVKNKKFLMYIGNTSSSSTVNIRAYDASNGLIVEKTVQFVRCYKNQKTLLTGSIFPTTASSSLGFTVSVNPTWSTPLAPITF